MTLAVMRTMLDLGRIVLAPLLGLLLLIGFCTPSLGQTEAERAQLDKLFAELKLAPDAQTANRIDQQIWLIWTAPAEPGLAGRMAAVLAARNAMDLGGAIRLLDKLVEDYPTYAEGWNQRATIYYMLDNYEASLADIDKVLEFEPRHFGALSGQALIYLSLGKRPLALKAMAAALAVHPFLNERQLFPELMQDITRI
jgi:tetratricopeptide (TPR) repeat protein